MNPQLAMLMMQMAQQGGGFPPQLGPTGALEGAPPSGNPLLPPQNGMGGGGGMQPPPPQLPQQPPRPPVQEPQFGVTPDIVAPTVPLLPSLGGILDSQTPGSPAGDSLRGPDGMPPRDANQAALAQERDAMQGVPGAPSPQPQNATTGTPVTPDQVPQMIAAATRALNDPEGMAAEQAAAGLEPPIGVPDGGIGDLFATPEGQLPQPNFQQQQQPQAQSSSQMMGTPPAGGEGEGEMSPMEALQAVQGQGQQFAPPAAGRPGPGGQLDPSQILQMLLAGQGAGAAGGVGPTLGELLA